MFLDKFWSNVVLCYGELNDYRYFTYIVESNIIQIKTNYIFDYSIKTLDKKILRLSLLKYKSDHAAAREL
jgi:hypothetical protein